MCGISGIISNRLSKDTIEQSVSQMMKAQKHRGPDDQGVWSYCDDVIALSLGHNRLSIIDVSEDGHQPMIDDATGNVVVFNGEIYNFKEIREDLVSRGYFFKSKSDTEVILKAYSEFGIECVFKLRGIFAFALWDNAEKKLILARDHMGVKPLYYYADGNSLYFASEVRALLSGGVHRKLSKDGLCSLLCYGSVQEPFSLVENVYSLEPGSYVIIDQNMQLSKSSYWSPSFVHSKTISVLEAERETTRLLDEAVKLQLVSDVPLGAFLSGGIDSSAIVALMRKVNPDAELHTYSIIFDDPKYDEREYARLVADRNRTNHTELRMTGCLIQSFLSEMINAYDQPSMDGMNSWFVSKLVKESGITVALSGVGGDELFVGYGNFSKPRQIYSYASKLKALPKVFGNIVEQMAWNEKIRKVGELVSYQYDPYFMGRRQFSDIQYCSLVNEENRVNPYQWLHISYDDVVNNEYVDDIAKISWYVQRSYMLSTLLRDTDQMSMNHSLEIRVPLLDHQLVEYVTALPMDIKMNMQMPKQLLVKAAGDGLPSECVHRRKQGFTFPFDSFIKNELHKDLSAFFLEDSSSLFNKKGLRKIWKEYLQGRIDWARIMALYVTNQWIKQHGLCKV